MANLPSVPLKVRLKAYNVFGSLRGVIPEWAKLEYTDKLNDLPTLTVKVATGSLAEKRLHAPVEIGLEISHGGEWFEPPNCRFISTGVDTDLVDAGAYTVIPCLGVGMALRWATVWEPTPGDEDGKRIFPASSPGKIINTLFQAAAARNDNNLAWGKGNIAWDVTDSMDTGHAAWGKNAAPQFATSATLYSVMGWLAGKGAIDWRFQARTLQAYKTNGGMARDNTHTALRAAFSTSLPLKTDLQNVVTTAKFRGNKGFERVKSSTDAYRGLGRIEAFSEQGQVTTESTATLYLDELLLRGHRPAREYRREYQLTMSEYAPFLWRDYLVGDWVSNGDETLRIVEAGIKADTDGTIKGWETLGSRIDSYLERLGRKTTNLETGAVGSDSGKPLPAGQDFRPPKAPDAVTADTNITVTADGIYRGIVTINWHAVTRATNNTSIEVDRYLVYARRSGESSYNIVAEAHNNTHGASFFADPGETLAVFIVAVTEAGRRSAPSATVRVDVAADTTPPPTPSAPSVTANLGVIHATWDKRDRSNQSMPPEFKTLEVEAISPDQVSESVTILPVGQHDWVYPTKQYGEYRVRIRAIDNAGNKSYWSQKSVVNVEPLVDTSGISREIADAKAEVAHDFNQKLGDATAALGTKVSREIADAKEEFSHATIPLERLRSGGSADGEFVKSLLSDEAFVKNLYSHQLVVASSNNLVRDPTFALSNETWAGGGDARGGAWTIHATGVWQQVTNAPFGVSMVKAGEEYVASIRVTPRGSALPARAVGIGVVFYDKDGELLKNLASYAQTGIDTGGDVLSVTFTPPANTVGASLYFFTFRHISNVAVEFSEPRLYQQVGATLIKDGAITTSKILANAITSEKILANAITSEKIRAGAIDASKIRANSITGDKIRAGSISAEKLEANSIKARHIQSHAIDGMTIRGAKLIGTQIQTNNNSNIGLKLNDGVLRVGDSAGREVFTLNAQRGDTVWTAPGSSNNITIDPTGRRDRVSLAFNTDGLPGWNSYPKISSISSAEHNYAGAYDAGALVITGAEKIVNSSGRVDMRIGPGMKFFIGTQRGPNNQKAELSADNGEIRLAAGGRIFISAGEAINLAPEGSYRTTVTFQKNVTRIVTQLKLDTMKRSTFGANVGIASRPYGELYWLSSSKKYKVAIKDYKAEGIKPEAILEVLPKTWVDRTQMEDYSNYLEDRSSEGAKTGKWDYASKAPSRIPGLIAEDVEAVGLHQYVVRGEDGKTIEGLQYDRLWTLLIPLVKDLRERVTKLERGKSD